MVKTGRVNIEFIFKYSSSSFIFGLNPTAHTDRSPTLVFSSHQLKIESNRIESELTVAKRSSVPWTARTRYFTSSKVLRDWVLHDRHLLRVQNEAAYSGGIIIEVIDLSHEGFGGDMREIKFALDFCDWSAPS